MTPFRNDETNPFARERVWPAMPQAPLHLAKARTVLGMGMIEPDPGPGVSPRSVPVRPRPRRRRKPRLTPLIGAAVVGAGGLLTLFLLIASAPAQP